MKPNPFAATAFAICLALLCSCKGATELSRTPLVLAQEAVDPVVWLFEEQQSNVVDILYATDRGGSHDSVRGVDYGSDRSRALAFGECSVEIGKSLPWKDAVERSPILRNRANLRMAIRSVQEKGKFPETPLPLVGEGDEIVEDPDEARLQEDVEARFRALLSSRLREAERQEVFLFVHGYNNSFADAAFVQAEMWHFLGRPGVGMIYSWPAGFGGLRGYTHDRESGEFTNFHFKQFLRMIARTPEVKKLHILAHSRGTDVVTTALRELFLEIRASGEDPREVMRIENLVLAAPDMDMEVVTQRVGAERLQFGLGRVTIYTSPHDRALGLSDWLFEGIRRMGRASETDLTETQKKNLRANRKVDVIQVTARSGFIGHGYFHSNPSVSSDLILLLRDGRAPGAEHGRPLTPVARNFWVLPPGYPENSPKTEGAGAAD